MKRIKFEIYTVSVQQTLSLPLAILIHIVRCWERDLSRVGVIYEIYDCETRGCCHRFGGKWSSPEFSDRT